MISPEKVQRFYAYGFNESDAHNMWSRIWSKQFARAKLSGEFSKTRKRAKPSNANPKLILLLLETMLKVIVN